MTVSVMAVMNIPQTKWFLYDADIQTCNEHLLSSLISFAKQVTLCFLMAKQHR